MSGLSYYLAKARYAPLADLPRYALRALRNRLAIRLGRRRHFDRWGPVFPGMDELESTSLDLCIARQWVLCVASAEAGLSALHPDRVLVVRYEAFTADPVAELSRIARWLGQDRSEAELRAAAAGVRPTSIGKGRSGPNTVAPEIAAEIGAQMRSLGYVI